MSTSRESNYKRLIEPCCLKIFIFQEILYLITYSAALLGLPIGIGVYAEFYRLTTFSFRDFYKQGLKSNNLPEVEFTSPLIHYTASSVTFLFVIWKRWYDAIVPLVSGFACIISFKLGCDCSRFLQEKPSKDIRLGEVHNSYYRIYKYRILRQFETIK